MAAGPTISCRKGIAEPAPSVMTEGIAPFLNWVGDRPFAAMVGRLIELRPMTKAQPDADALGRPRAELVGPTTIAAMYGAAVYVDRRRATACKRQRNCLSLSRRVIL